MNSAPRIAIIGAGPGGLTCANILQRHGIPVTVAERDAAPDTRPQGGTLDLHADSGQLALSAAGLLDEFLAISRPEGQETRLLDRAGTELFRHTPRPGELAKPEIDRGQLRRLLLDALAPGTVRWGRALRTVRPLGDGTHRAVFEDGSTGDFDLVVGADGAWSRVRPLLSDATPGYTGITFVETGLDDADTRHAALAELIGRGMMMALAPDRCLFAQRNSNHHIRVYVAFRGPRDWYRAAGVDLRDPRAVRAALLAKFADWDSSLLAMVRDADGGFVNRPLFALPVGHSWDHVPGLTLLGDAAHLMSPFAGMGVNLAMLDGAELARAVLTESGLAAAVKAYETTMLPRSAEAARDSATGCENSFAADAPYRTLREWRRH
ncbi:FAD-dependent oxidoreductase [Amycolatopsis anabasis]|uniref:FAD-dependent oxidoreductase n=1 Tax=Amycolatopsis anabasis TaxID=1840409 RepID=UPI00131BE714|nr:NAD(P)/FAD-dependent oxidoreductase [Amycolatopsis anabasis]